MEMHDEMKKLCDSILEKSQYYIGSVKVGTFTYNRATYRAMVQKILNALDNNMSISDLEWLREVESQLP